MTDVNDQNHKITKVRYWTKLDNYEIIYQNNSGVIEVKENYYTIEEVAEKLAVHPKTIRRYIYSGKIQALKVGGQWRILESALEDYYQESKHCCSGDSVSKDDFCVFMDGEAVHLDTNLQLCTIVDYYVENQREAKPLINKITEVMLNEDDQNEYKFNYVYDANEKRVRCVIWGSAAFIEKVCGQIKDLGKKK